MIRMRKLALGALLLGAPAAAFADETALVLRPPEAEAARVRANCSGCHSVDYILMNSPFLARAGWEAEVRKMIRVMGAPVSDADAAAIVDYLVTQYGPR